MDINPENKPTVVGDVHHLPFAEGSFDEVHAQHSLEHFPYFEVEHRLREWAGLVKPGGTLRVAVPDLGWAAEMILQGSMTVGVLALIYGSQTNEWECHRGGFTLPTLAGWMENVGLEVEEHGRAQMGIMVEHPSCRIVEPVGEIFVVGRK